MMRRLDEAVERHERALFDGMGVRPYWQGKVGWRWRLIMAYHALRGRELGGWW
jgi:hypothetical protein